MKINISRKNKAKILLALWRDSKAQGIPAMLSQILLTREPTEQDALDELNGTGNRIDYFAGRPIKIDFSKDEIDTWLYDRDNGEGAAQRAIDSVF